MNKYGLDLNKIIVRDKIFYELKTVKDDDGKYTLKVEKVKDNGEEIAMNNFETNNSMDSTQSLAMSSDITASSNYNPTYQGCTNFSYQCVQEICNASLTDNQQQNLKQEFYQSIIRNMEFAQRKNIEIDAYNRKKNIDLVYMKEAELLKKTLVEGRMQSSLVTEDGIVLAQNDDWNLQNSRRSDNELIEDFIDINELVREHDRSSGNGYNILKRNYTFNRYEHVAKEELRVDFEEYLYNSRPNLEIPTSAIDRMFRTLLHKVRYIDDLIQEQKVIKIAKYTVATLNGYYDLEKNIFVKKENFTERIFNKTSLPINFLEEDDEPKIFNRLLESSFGSDKKIITVVYEYIGAMLSGIPIIKKIFVLQGVSNSGKSRITRIIASFFHKSDVIYIDKLTDLKDEINFDNAMLIIIDELSDKKISSSQVSKLKKLSNGSKQVKILATTNHPISTESDGSVDMALYNRLAVVPFKHVMNNSDPEVSAYEDVYLETEREVIVSKALRVFHEVLTRSESISNLQFSEEFPLNGCVERKIFPNEYEEIRFDPKCVQKFLCEKNQIPSSEDVLKNVVSSLYELSDEINPAVTAESVMQNVNEILGKKHFKDVQSFGKKLKGYYGDKLRSERKNGKVCYNLKYRRANLNPTQIE